MTAWLARIVATTSRITKLTKCEWLEGRFMLWNKKVHNEKTGIRVLSLGYVYAPRCLLFPSQDTQRFDMRLTRRPKRTELSNPLVWGCLRQISDFPTQRCKQIKRLRSWNPHNKGLVTKFNEFHALREDLYVLGNGVWHPPKSQWLSPQEHDNKGIKHSGTRVVIEWRVLSKILE